MRTALLYGADEFVGEWVRRRLSPDVRPFTDFTAVGVVAPNADGSHRIIAGVVWNMYYGHMISTTFAADSPRWASRRVLADLFAYPFCQLNVERITALTGRKNRKARELLVKLGFHLEGTMRKGFSRSEDGMLYGMLRSECRWLREGSDDTENRDDGRGPEGLRQRRWAADRQRGHAGLHGRPKPVVGPDGAPAADAVRPGPRTPAAAGADPRSGAADAPARADLPAHADAEPAFGADAHADAALAPDAVGRDAGSGQPAAG